MRRGQIEGGEFVFVVPKALVRGTLHLSLSKGFPSLSLPPPPRLLWRCTLQLFKPLTCCSRRLSHPHLEAPGAVCSSLGLACCSVLSGKDAQGGGSEWGDGESLTCPLILERAPELDLLSKREQRPNKNTYR